MSDERHVTAYLPSRPARASSNASDDAEPALVKYWEEYDLMRPRE
jgi:hypothetical protein